nr:hypothetical protein [Tanacetum cinerariifolium]
NLVHPFYSNNVGLPAGPFGGSGSGYGLLQAEVWGKRGGKKG